MFDGEYVFSVGVMQRLAVPLCSCCDVLDMTAYLHYGFGQKSGGVLCRPQLLVPYLIKAGEFLVFG